MSKIVSRFSEDSAEGMTLRAVAMFGIAAAVVSVLAASALQDYSEQYAENQSYGVDRVMTGSINKTKRYTVHKSVLTKTPVRICSDVDNNDC